MRFLHYSEAGGRLVPHVDLAKSLGPGVVARAGVAADDAHAALCSTHTFLLYLTAVGAGGETVLLERLAGGPGRKGAAARDGDRARRPRAGGAAASDDEAASDERADVDDAAAWTAACGVIASVAPKRGRLLIFPHACPHAGLAVVDVPKIVVRGELGPPHGAR